MSRADRAIAAIVALLLAGACAEAPEAAARIEPVREGVDWIEPLPASLESVLIAEEDSLGVPRVSRYRLIRAERKATR